MYLSISSRPYLVIAALLLLGLLVFITSKPSSDEAGQSSNHYHQVQAHSLVSQEEFALKRRFSGAVRARQRTDMGFEQGGKLATVLVDEGEQVVKGQVIATLDTELLRIQRQELDARLAETRAQLNLNRSSLQRQGALRKNGFASEQSMDELQSQQDVLMAALARLDASVASVASRIRKSTLIAPFAGVVTRRFADEGTVVDAGMAVVRLQEQGSMELNVGVPVKMAARLSPGEELEIEVGGQQAQARLITVGADVHPVTRTVAVRLDVQQLSSVVNGELAYLYLEDVVQRPGFWVPVEAVTDGLRGLWRVLVLLPGGEGLHQLEARDVQIAYAERDRLYIHGAVSQGERIVTSGLHRVVHGQRVVVDEENADEGNKVVESKP